MSVHHDNLSSDQAALLGYAFQALLNSWPEGIAEILFNTAWQAWINTTADPERVAHEILEILYESRPDLREVQREHVLVFRLPR